MNKKLLLVLAFVTISSVYCADEDYQFKADMDRCVDTADDLFIGCTENNGDCEFYQGLVNISITAELTVEQKVVYEQFVEKCKTEIFAKSEYSNEQKFIEFSSYLAEFSYEHEEVYQLVQHQNVSTWSSLFTVEKVTIIKQQQTIQHTIVLDSKKSCPLFKSLLQAAEATGDAQMTVEVQELIETKLIQIIENTEITFEEQTILIQEAITQFCESRVSFKAELEFTKIVGFGSFFQFSKCVTTYKQYSESAALCTGTFPDIPIIEYLQIQLNIYKQQDIRVALQFNQFIQRVNQSFQQITTVEERHIWFANYVEQWKVLNYEFCAEFIFSCEFGVYGSLFDFCFVQGFEGPRLVTFPPVVETTSAVEMTTVVEEATSTVEPAVTSSTNIPSTVEDEETTFMSSTVFYTEIPSTASSCACVCE